MCQRVMSLIAMNATTKIKADSFLGPDLLQKCLLTLCGFPPNTGETNSKKKRVERELPSYPHLIVSLRREVESPSQLAILKSVHSFAAFLSPALEFHSTALGLL